MFYSDPRKTRAKLLKNKHIKNNQQKQIYERQREKQNKFQQLREEAKERKNEARKNRPQLTPSQKQRNPKIDEIYMGTTLRLKIDDIENTDNCSRDLKLLISRPSISDTFTKYFNRHGAFKCLISVCVRFHRTDYNPKKYSFSSDGFMLLITNVLIVKFLIG